MNAYYYNLKSNITKIGFKEFIQALLQYVF